MGIFGGISVTAIVWFLLINGLKGSSIMTPELKALINAHTWHIIVGGTSVSSVVMTLLSAMKLPVPKYIVLFGTFALAMAFAAGDLVNFVGVPLTGLEAYQDYAAHGGGDAQNYLMTSLMGSAQTPTLYLVLAGVVMVFALIFSKKAQNVVKTSVDLSRQDEGDEMFGSSGVARTLVRTSTCLANGIVAIIPERVAAWVDSRFNTDAAVLRRGAAFDEIRAAVNLVLAGALVALGTSLKLPLSTTYVTFMVAMGTSLADRAWGRESAVFRITGVLSVIGGWFITAGAAFAVCYVITGIMHFGGIVAMVASMALAVFLLVRSNLKPHSLKSTKTHSDEIFTEMVHATDRDLCWQLLRQHVSATADEHLRSISHNYATMTTAFFQEDYRQLKRTTSRLTEERKDLKRQRRKQIVGLRRIDPMLSIERGTWFFLVGSSLSQMIYCLKRMGDPCREHVGNNFRPVPTRYASEFLTYRDTIVSLFERTLTAESTEQIRTDAERLQTTLSDYRKRIIIAIQGPEHYGIEPMTVLLGLVQESQELLSGLRHTLRGLQKFLEHPCSRTEKI